MEREWGGGKKRGREGVGGRAGVVEMEWGGGGGRG